MKLVAVPVSRERVRNLTTTGLGEQKRRPRSETKPEATQSPLRIRSGVLVQLEALDKDVVAEP